MDEQARLLYCVAPASLAHNAPRTVSTVHPWHEVTSLLTYPERQAYQLLYGLPGFDIIRSEAMCLPTTHARFPRVGRER